MSFKISDSILSDLLQCCQTSHESPREGLWSSKTIWTKMEVQNPCYGSRANWPCLVI